MAIIRSNSTQLTVRINDLTHFVQIRVIHIFRNVQIIVVIECKRPTSQWLYGDKKNMQESIVEFSHLLDNDDACSIGEIHPKFHGAKIDCVTYSLKVKDVHDDWYGSNDAFVVDSSGSPRWNDGEFTNHSMNELRTKTNILVQPR